LLSLNFEKTRLIQFLNKKSSHISIRNGCDNNVKSNINSIKLLETKIDNTITLKSHKEMLIRKFGVACFAVQAIKPFVTQDNLKKVYHFYFHSIINYGIIFRGNSSYSNRIFKLQKRNIRIIMGVGTSD